LLNSSYAQITVQGGKVFVGESRRASEDHSPALSLWRLRAKTFSLLAILGNSHRCATTCKLSIYAAPSSSRENSDIVNKAEIRVPVRKGIEQMLDARSLIGTHDALFITLDTLRYDVARDALAEGRTPNLAALLPGGAWEERQSPGNF